MRRAKGFTLAEALLVLLLAGMLSVLTLPSLKSRDLALMMRRIKLSLETMQMEAYTRKEVLLAGIEESGMDINGVYTAFPKGMACTPAKIYFNEKGNTAAAGHFTCFQGSQTWKLVWQLGQGRIRIEPV